ncbi:unnamed protein product [Hyaloperonospora brassicae]|uniref:RxLR effector candidate protein n=1 Tax=Hyaloperonospora brassicae TaxID=162125 RepID=A0AAV0UYL3_HYABA|nr:unnamed protein product [Hyaloperonospora brassicae]
MGNAVGMQVLGAPYALETEQLNHGLPQLVLRRPLEQVPEVPTRTKLHDDTPRAPSVEQLAAKLHGIGVWGERHESRDDAALAPGVRSRKRSAKQEQY